MIDNDLRKDVADLVRRAVELSEAIDDELAEVVRSAAEEPFSDEELRPLFERIVELLLAAGVRPTAEQRLAMRADVEKALSAVTAERRRGGAAPKGAEGGGLKLHALNGLPVRAVLPTPEFNGKSVAMMEGYVGTEDLRLWPENHRIELDVAEFEETHHRKPNNDELIQILQGVMPLPARDSTDPYKIKALADSIAAKGVRVPPIIDADGTPYDGNRRIAAALLVLFSDEYKPDQKDRARYVRVWQTAPEISDDQIEAIVVSLNFEPDQKLAWPDYVKARQVANTYDELYDLERVAPSPLRQRQFRQQVAERFAIKVPDVTRYIKMVRWADRFEQHHVENRNRSEPLVRYRANELFQYFIELDAGRGEDKLSARMQEDEELEALVFDLMFDRKFRNWTQLRNLRKVLASERAFDLVKKAHLEVNEDEGRKLIQAAFEEARHDDVALKRIGMRDWLGEIVRRLDGAPPAVWQEMDTTLLRSVRRALMGAEGAIKAELVDRGVVVADRVVAP